MDAATVNGQQDKVDAALLGSDWEMLNGLVTSDARITGPRGFVIGRDEWIDVHKKNDCAQVKLGVVETDVQAYEDLGSASTSWNRSAPTGARPSLAGSA